MSFKILKNSGVNIIISDSENSAVKLAAENLKTDLNKVIGAVTGSGAEIIVGTFGVSDKIGEYVTEADFEVNGKLHKETYLHKVVGDKLILAGRDRRGTIYAIYEFSESIGVSPWYFFADVPVKTKDIIELSDGYVKKDYPTVEYRGIFINDEEELEHWVQLNMGEETIGVKTYEKIFELLLRLKANYIWPAMHVNSFNIKKENGELADRMGIVVGTSHCDMLMRSNNREWYPWIEKKGYTDAKYDYSLEGRNRDILKEYWRESIEQNKDFEVSYTIGMRGIHDSGFEVEAFEGLEGDELLKAKINLLETVMTDQEKMLRDILPGDTLKTFVPYKEVLNLYDAGLNVPEDLTLIWSNDNYGYIRRYPGEKEKKRAGGNGIYYHNSYWAPPGGMSYLFICSYPLAHTKNELRKAFYEGIQRIWVLNVGAIKPIEASMEYFIRYAWEIDKEETTDDVDAYLEQWINKNFSGNYGKECAQIFNDFDQLTNMRKVEQLSSDTFSVSAYGDEWSARINKYKELYDKGNAIYNSLPDEEKVAFYQLVLMKIHAGYYMNAQFYYADKSRRANKAGHMGAAERYTELSLSYDDKKRQLIEYYNHHMLNGKWNGILTPEMFEPPVAAMHPANMPPIEITDNSMSVSIWNDEKEINFVKNNKKWIDVVANGEDAINFEISYPDWISVSAVKSTANPEKRVFVSTNGNVDNANGEISVKNLADNTVITVPVSVDMAKTDCNNIEDGGIVSVDANTAKGTGWIEIKRLGRGFGSLMEAKCKDALLSYEIFTTEDSDNALVEIFRFPSLNSTGRIRIDVSIDGSEFKTVESESNDEWRGTWRENTKNNVDKLYMSIGKLSKGLHTVTFRAVDKYFAFTKFALYTSDRKENNMATVPFGWSEDLPQVEESWDLYNISLMPRPQRIAQKTYTENTLLVDDTVVYPERYGDAVSKKSIIEEGNSIFEERAGAIKIDAAAALANTEFANCKNGEWTYCNSESYARTSIAMYTDESIKIHNEENDSPNLCYKVNVTGGKYTVWELVKLPQEGNCYTTIGFDGYIIPRENHYNKSKVWRYEGEHVWRWVPITECELSEGEHTMNVYSRTTQIRFDRFYITKGEELPPLDMNW